jgi:hypothetical protein
MTGLLMLRAYHQSKGSARKKILIPDSAHGTNPATAAMVNFAVKNLKSDSRRKWKRIRRLCSMLRAPREFLVWMRPQPLGLGNLFYGGSLRTELLIVDFLMVD